MTCDSWLFCERHVDGYTVVAVGGWVGTGGHEWRVHLIVEVRTHSHALAHHIVCGEINTQCACAACRLCRAIENLTDEGGVVVDLEIKIQRQVVAHALLPVLHLQHRVEVGNLIASAKHKRFSACFHQLTSRRVERKRAGIAILGIEGDVVVHCSIHTNQRSKLLSDGHR